MTHLIFIYKMYVTLKFDDNGCCRIHSVSDGDKEIVMKGMWLCPGSWLPEMIKT